MNAPSPSHPAVRNRRLLVIDDNVAIHEDVRKILCPVVNQSAAALADLEQELLGTTTAAPAPDLIPFSVDSAHQGREGLALVRRAVEEGRPYAMAFVDVRMPPGWDGIETTTELWKVQPDLQIVICTAYSDYSWEEMINRLGRNDRLVVLRKPFDTIEVLQLANALTEKWNLTQESRRHAAELEERVRLRTADLEAANAALHAEIQRRVEIEADLKRARDAAEGADRAKSAFLANMSHEIRTPMNGVVGMANLLTATPLNAEQRDFVRTLGQCCDSLLTIINDILDFSKIEAGRMELESIDFDLGEALQLTLDLHAEAAARKGLELVLALAPDVPPLVRGDSVRLRQVVMNLVANAVKFTETGAVVVRAQPCESTSPDRVGLSFEVTDTGVGIPAAVIPTLFQPFVQADSSTTRRYGGTGLGLAICKRIVELMHGSIGVRSAPGEGSTFWFRIELARASAGEPIAFLPPPSAGRGVLVVDDSEPSRELLGQLLGRWGIEAVLHHSAVTALQDLRRCALSGTPYRLVLVDRTMPEMDGLEFAARVREDPQLAGTLLVLLTGRNERLTAEEITRQGFNAHETKPVHPERLRTTIGHLLTPRLEPDVVEMPAPTVHETPILVAEDNAVNQKVIALMLRNLGYACEIVPNGRQALELLREREFALVLMDEHMPEMDGVEATRQIRADGVAGLLASGAHVPIIATTADAMPGTRQRCLDAGMDDYLAKPIRVDALSAMLTAHLKPLATPHRACAGN